MCCWTWNSLAFSPGPIYPIFTNWQWWTCPQLYYMTTSLPFWKTHSVTSAYTKPLYNNPHLFTLWMGASWPYIYSIQTQWKSHLQTHQNEPAFSISTIPTSFFNSISLHPFLTCNNPTNIYVSQFNLAHTRNASMVQTLNSLPTCSKTPIGRPPWHG